MSKQKRTWDVILAVVMVLLCLLWIYPIVLILLNSLKTEGSFTTSTVFRLPTAETFAGLRNYVYGVTKMDFLSSMGYSLLITITSVVLILLCCSMTGWYLTRVNNKLSKFMNLLIVFSMVVPFQMVMFTLSKTADRLKLNTPWNICIIYLGFGAGLAVFMFTGFMKSVPMEIEEAAMIDGAGKLRRIWHIDLPGIGETIAIMLILKFGSMMSTGFEKIYSMQADLNLSVSEVISTYVYKMGMMNNKYSYSAAISLFNNVINFTLLILVNKASSKLSGSSLW